MRCSAVVDEVRTACNEAGAKIWVATLDEAVIEWEDVVLLCFGQEVGLQLFQLVRILCGDVVGFAEVL
jgi:hypothetical protein